MPDRSVPSTPPKDAELTAIVDSEVALKPAGSPSRLEAKLFASHIS